jgi:Protein of unknown function (DUF1573)
MALANIFIALSFLQPQPPAAQDLRFPQPQVNLGELRSHVVRNHRFEFVNQGPETVEIVRVEPSCGCLAVKLDKRLFGPGERGGLSMDIRPTAQSTGPQSWFAKVVYRAGNRQETVHLQVQAVVRHEVSVVPAVLVWTGAGSQEVTVTDLRDPPLAVTELHFSSTLVQAKVVSSEKGVSRIVLQAASAIPPGRRDEMLSIYTADPAYRQLQIPVTLIGQTRQAVSATPAQVSLNVATGQPIPSTLRPAGDRKLEVQSVAADDPAITCTFAKGPFNETTLKIQVDAGKLGSRDLNASVRVHLREPADEILVIPVRISR